MGTSNDVGLRRTLYLIDYERTLRMRELDNQRRQFLHHRHETVPSYTDTERSFHHKREELRKRIEREKDLESRRQSSLLERKADFMDNLKALEVSLKARSAKKLWLEVENEKEGAKDISGDKSNENGSLEYAMENHNRIAGLYQRGFNLLKRRKEASQNPLLASVNAILQKLRNQKETTNKDGDPFSHFSKSIIKTFDSGGDDSNVEQNGVLDPLNVETKTREATDDINYKADLESPNDVDTAGNKREADERQTQDNNNVAQADVEKKTLTEKSSISLDLWATVKKEQRKVREMARQQKESRRISANHSPTYAMNGNSDGHRITKLDVTKNNNSSGQNARNHSSSSPPKISPRKQNTSRLMGSPRKSPDQRSCILARGTQSNESYETFMTNGKEVTANKKISNGNRESKNNSSPECPSKRVKIPKLARDSKRDTTGDVKISISDECIEECDETTTPNTVVVVHKGGDELSPPVQWDQGYRYSLGQRDNEVITTNDFFQGLVDDTKQDDEAFPEETTETSEVRTEEPIVLNLLDLNQISRGTETTDHVESQISHRSQAIQSARSLHSVSELGSDLKSVSSRQLGSTKRRLSMQTRGSLRALSGLMKEENRRQQQMENENTCPESDTYRAICEALAGVAADADEQTQRLKSVRRASLGLTPVNKETRFQYKALTNIAKDGNNLTTKANMRRNTIEAPGVMSSADVTDEVYKFLQHRNRSKTKRPFKTLSNVELKLLAHAPGEDITGRRHSFSSQLSSRQSSSSNMSLENFRRMPICSGSRKASSEMSVVLESEMSHSQRNSARAGSAAASTRPQSVAMSDVSKTDRSSSLEIRKNTRSYSWAPDVSETKEWHVLAMELLVRQGNGMGKFRSVSDMLQGLGEEYRRQTAAMMYEELRYCSYLRLPKHQLPSELIESDINTVFASGTSSPN